MKGFTFISGVAVLTAALLLPCEGLFWRRSSTTVQTTHPPRPHHHHHQVGVGVVKPMQPQAVHVGPGHVHLPGTGHIHPAGVGHGHGQGSGGQHHHHTTVASGHIHASRPRPPLVGARHGSFRHLLTTGRHVHSHSHAHPHVHA